MAFFVNRRFPISHIVLGQYVGMGSLLAVGLLGVLIALVVPNNLIGLMGLLPIAIGIKELLELRKDDDADDDADGDKANDESLCRVKGSHTYLS